MQALISTSVGAFAERRRRALELREVYPHAAEMLELYHALCDVQEQGYLAAARTRPSAAELPAFVAEQVLPGVLEATLAAGPAQLRDSVLSRFHEADLAGTIGRWLVNEALTPTDEYLARAAASPVLEAVGGFRPDPRAPADERHCPGCGALPQLSYFALSEEALVTGPRHLLCSHCSMSWVYPRLCCAACGCTESDKLPIFADWTHFANLRLDACEACHRYSVTVEVAKDPSAVPIVDEIAALPLDLYARERGFSKITANLMGF